MITPGVVDYAVDVVNIALAAQDLLVEIVHYEDDFSNEVAIIRSPRWEITLREPTPDERRAGVRLTHRVDESAMSSIHITPRFEGQR